MANIINREDWNRPGVEATPEESWLNRRRLIKLAGMVGIGAALPAGALALFGERQVPDEEVKKTLPPVKAPFPVKRSTKFTVPERKITPELVSAAYNNFYELGTGKTDPVRNAAVLKPTPWTLEVTGMVAKPLKLDLDDLYKKFALEERLYRFRCVEAWAATVPWTGFPLAALLKLAEVKKGADHVRFVTTKQKDLPGIQKLDWYQWPYYEALTLPEATADMTLVTLGSYGRALPNQHGAPVRIICPWKYGYKSPKSIVKIEVVKGRPKTFWNDLQPSEYSFQSNVDPKKPHPRWSQATERLLSTGNRVPTKYLNGYAKQVGSLYS